MIISVLLEHQAPIILHYFTLMAKNTNVLKSRGPGAASAAGASAQSKSPARLRNKTAMMKGLAESSNPCYSMEEPASCASWEGILSTAFPYFHLAFPRVHCSSSVRVYVHPGAGVLVSKHNAEETRTCWVTNYHLHHHSACFSQCSPYGLTTHCRCIKSFFFWSLML